MAENGISPEQMLREFHASKAIHGGLMPDAPTAGIPGWVRDLRLALLAEEVRELHDAAMEGDIVPGWSTVRRSVRPAPSPLRWSRGLRCCDLLGR